MHIKIPELALVVLIGASGSGKSTFAKHHFKSTEVLSSDFCRGLVSDDENDQSATKDAFDVLHFIAAKRLAAGRLTVVDATNVQVEARKPLVALAREYHCLPVAIVLDLPERVCQERNRSRADRDFGPHVIRRQTQDLRRSLRGLQREGFRHVFVLDGPEAVATVTVTREPLWTNRKHEHGPFDIIGDVHGCAEELRALLRMLDYTVAGENEEGLTRIVPPEGRKAIFLGDLVDRGPQVPTVLRMVMDMVKTGAALCIPGNHDMKLLRKLRGKDVQITHGLAESLAQLEAEPPEFRQEVAEFLDELVSHYVLDDGNLVVAHAGMKEALQGRGSRTVREFALYGETTGETDEFGLPIRYNWAAEYRGHAMVVYGHTPVPQPEWLNRTINIDTGCVFGGQLTALRYPEKELVSVPALYTYAEPARPFLAETEQPAPTAQQAHDDVLDIDDVIGKRRITTRLHRDITIREENALAALEVMSRFAADPKWLIYLPPAMSPSETTQQPALLEHPAEAFAYYRHAGVPRVICEEKHMGSRAVLVVCRDAEVARRRFGVGDGTIGICYTRTGRRFFDDPTIEAGLLRHIRATLDAAGTWEALQTDWVCLDCELMPWSAKAQGLLHEQYAPVGTAARAALDDAGQALQSAAARDVDVAAVLSGVQERKELAELYRSAYRRYCWPVHSLADLKLAPFHILASEDAVHVDKNHLW
ncbi:MAG TPA: polynucleotide kinase-phosphatase, partial [Herpetosiphonaceae bacterium]|nr:polynucleotide kinase-phosphatase [Herpetosiphonaceae bacterium]